MQTDSKPFRIYLDTCCLSRLFDPPTQVRVRQEAEDIGQILTFCFRGNWNWISSTILSDEIEQTADLTKRVQMKALLSITHQTISAGTDIRTRGNDLELLGFQQLDALHIACAEVGEVDVFLTTDDRLLRRAQRYQSQLYIRVENPVTWLEEVTGNGHFRDDRS